MVQERGGSKEKRNKVCANHDIHALKGKMNNNI